jgi:hypothetical protein
MKFVLLPEVRKLTFTSILLFSIAFCSTCCTNKKPDEFVLTKAHAHNDYEHARPLMDALSFGFISVEVDIHLLDDQLYVAHDSIDIKRHRTLQKLYLDPLKNRIQRNNGVVYDKKNRFILLIDIKTDALNTYKKLHIVLKNYKEIFTSFDQGLEKPGPVLAIISGNRPIEYIKNQDIRYAAIDGRFENLNLNDYAIFFPLVSENWNNYFTWKGEFSMPIEEKEKLDSIITILHTKNQMLRFWATPDSASVERTRVWSELLNAGVDLIGTDDLEGLSTFFNTLN